MITESVLPKTLIIITSHMMTLKKRNITVKQENLKKLII